jgi:hypothetical protein
MKNLVNLIERAAKDPDFLSGVLSPDELKTVLGMPNSSEREIAETLQARISHGHSGKH